MSGAKRDERVGTGVLAGRMAIGEANHPRVAEPTAGAVLAAMGAPPVAAVGDDATVLDALKAMAEHDVAAVAVLSPTAFLGLFTERDHARSGLLGNRTAQNTPVVDLADRAPPTVAPGDTLRHCERLLAAAGGTHLAVVDRGRPVGILSVADLAAARIAHHERIFHEAETDRKLLFLRGTYSC